MTEMGLTPLLHTCILGTGMQDVCRGTRFLSCQGGPTMKTLLCVGDLSKRFNVSVAQVKYVVRRAGIEPDVSVGRTHGFSEAAAVQVGAVLASIAARKSEIAAETARC